MKQYSESEIKDLHQEFKTLKKYIEKLIFFDLHFEIIPFSFPDFDPELSLFFENKKTEFLTGIYKKERNNPTLFERRFYFESNYRFNIKPANSNSSIYSTYIFSRFLSATPDFDELIKRKDAGDAAGNLCSKPLLEEANRIVNQIEYKLQNEYDKSLKLHYMTVFYKGLYDSFSEQVTIPDKKRKFIELYLYAQGILYEKYLKAIRSHYDKPVMVPVLPTLPSSLKNKILLLREAGVVDQFKKKYAALNDENIDDKISALICMVTGENMTLREMVRDLLSSTDNSKDQQVFHLHQWKNKLLK